MVTLLEVMITSQVTITSQEVIVTSPINEQMVEATVFSLDLSHFHNTTTTTWHRLRLTLNSKFDLSVFLLLESNVYLKGLLKVQYFIWYIVYQMDLMHTFPNTKY